MKFALRTFRFQLGFLTVAIGSLIAVAPLYAGTFSRQDLHAAFINVAFGVEVQDSQSRPGIYIRKFAQDVRYWVVSTDPKKASQIARLLETIDSHLDISIDPAGAVKQANYFVYIYPVEQKEMYNRSIMEDHGYSVAPERLELYDELNCRFSIFPSRQGIKKSIVFLPTQAEPDWSYCVTEEMLQAFGLLNDASGIPHTVMNDKQDSLALTNFDLYLLKMLYDKRIKPGMSAKKVKAVLDPNFPKKDATLPFSQPDLDVCSTKGGELHCVASH